MSRPELMPHPGWMRLFRWRMYWRVSLGAGLLLGAGCTLPRMSSGIVDQQTPAFQAALASEKERLEPEVPSARKRNEIATRNVTRRFTDAEKTRRLEAVEPLVQALSAMAQPRGCWAYTVTTVRTSEDGGTTTNIETFNPSEPMERAWTLVSRDGVSPDASALSDYRRRKEREWKRQLRRQERDRSEADAVKLQAVWDDFEVVATPDGLVRYTFLGGRMGVALLARSGGFRREMTLDPATGELRGSRLATLGQFSFLGGSVKIDHLDDATEYAVVDPALPPFPIQRTTHFRMRAFGRDSGDSTEWRHYSDYRRVTCYDDRFEVEIGPPQMIDFLPGPD